MTYFYVELFALLLLSFFGGCAAAGLAVRLLVRRTAEDVTPYTAREPR
jgi:hypothetical protein